MYRTTLFALAAAFAATLPARADEKLTPPELLKKAIAAAGGEALLKKYPAMTEKAKGTMDLAGFEVTFTSDAMIEGDRMKAVLNVEIAGVKKRAVQIVNGDKVRATVNGEDQPLDEAAKAEIRESMQLRRLGQLTPLLEDKVTYDLKVGDPAKVGDAEALVLIVKSRELRETKIFFDAKTFLILKLEKRGIDGTLKECTQEIFPSDYRRVEGVLVAKKTRVLADGKKLMESETTEVKLLEKIPPTEFDISD